MGLPVIWICHHIYIACSTSKCCNSFLDVLVPFAVLRIVERHTFGCDLIRMINVAASRVASGDFFFHRHFLRSLFQPTPHPPTLSGTPFPAPQTSFSFFTHSLSTSRNFSSSNPGMNCKSVYSKCRVCRQVLARWEVDLVSGELLLRFHRIPRAHTTRQSCPALPNADSCPGSPFRASSTLFAPFLG